MHLLGRNEWGLRFPLAVALVLAALAVGGIARTFWGKEPSRVAALAYATSLGPFLAANVLTPDTLLAATVAGFYYGYVRAEAAASSRGRVTGWLLAGLAAGLGLLAKGPALLLWAAPVPVHLLLRRRLLAALRGPGPWLGAIVALSVGLPWFLWISRTLPGAWSYILDSEVVGRLATGTYQRNAGTFGGFKVYLPTLLALSLPWGPIALYVWRRRRGAGAASPAVDREGLRPRALLWLWVFLPLAVLWAASSRLPLYALPMSGALALAAARACPLAPRGGRGADSPGGGRPSSSGAASYWRSREALRSGPPIATRVRSLAKWQRRNRRPAEGTSTSSRSTPTAVRSPSIYGPASSW